MIQKLKKPISILLVFMMVVSLFTIVPISASAATWTFKLNSNFSGEWNANTDVVSEQPVELNLAEGDYEFQIVAYEDGNLSSYRGNEVAGSFTENYSQIMYDNGGNAKFHADGGKYTLTYNAGDGVLTINPVYVAEINGTNYKTLEAAVAAAQDGETIKLLASSAGNGIKVPQGKFNTNGLTIDFDLNTYTVDGETVGSTGTETNGFQLLKDNKITFTNGTITSEKAKILVQNYSNLTLDNMTLTLDNPNYAGAYTLSNNNGNIVIDETTINANPAGGFAFDVCRYASYPSVNVTVTGGSQINGDVEISASGSDAKDGFSLNLESGNIDGDIVLDASAKTAMADTPEKAKVSKAASFAQDAPADYKWDNNGVLVPCEYVAQNITTGAKYETLDDAFAAAQDGNTIKLLANITLPAQTVDGESVQYGAYITKSLTIDGDGHTVTSAAPRVFGVKGKQGDIDVTFKNITVTDNAKGAICVCTRGGINSLTLDNATLSTQGATQGYIQPLTIGGSQATQAKVNVINGSTIQTGEAAGKHYAIILWNPVDLTIKDSTIKGWACIYQKAFEDASADVKTEVTIDNSKLISKGIAGASNNFATIFTENADFSCDITNTTMDITAAAGTYQAVAASNGSASGFKVKLGEGNNATLTGDKAIIGYNFDDDTHEIAVSGGTFNKSVAEYYCAEGYIPATLDEETGKYSVKTGAYVAQIGTTKYETLEAAVAAAQDGETVKVLADCSGNGIIVPQGKFANGLTVDFDGHTYTVDGETVGSTGTETNGFQLLKDNKITFTNGTITSAKAKILVQNYSNLTLDGMTLTLNNPNYNSAYTLSNNNGNIVIDDTTIEANPAGGFAFDVCRYSSYPSVHVTVTGNSQIKGNVEISASKGNAREGFSLTLESGTMSGNIVVDASAQALVGEDNKVTKKDTFTKDAPEGFKWVSNEDGTSYLAKIQKLFASHSISLNGNVNLNFYINTKAIPGYANASSVTARFTWDSELTEYGKHYGDDVVAVDLKKLTPDANGIVVAYVPVNAAQMANDITAKVYVGDGEALEETDVYSVMEYGKELINGDDYSDAAKTLVKEMLNYGAMAQTVFGEQFKDAPDVSANSVLSATDRNAISEEMSNVNSATIIGAVEAANGGHRGVTMDELRDIGTRIGGKWYTTSVIFLNGNTLRHYFDDEKEGQMNKEGYHGVQDGWFYYVEKKNIAANDLDTLYTFTIGGQSFQYSVLDYAAAILESNMSPDAQNLAKALYLYNQAANAYFGN